MMTINVSEEGTLHKHNFNIGKIGLSGDFKGCQACLTAGVSEVNGK